MMASLIVEYERSTAYSSRVARENNHLKNLFSWLWISSNESDMMMCDLGMECPIGAMTQMRKRGKEHAKHRNPNPTTEEIWQTKHRNPCLNKSGSARNADASRWYWWKKHAHKSSQSEHTPSSSSSSKWLDLSSFSSGMISPSNLSPNQIKSKTSLDTTNDHIDDSDLWSDQLKSCPIHF